MKNILLYSVVILLFGLFSCSNDSSKVDKRTEKDANLTQTEGSGEKSEAPSDISGAWLTCGPISDPEKVKFGSILYGCAFMTKDGRKYEGKLDNMKIQIATSDNQLMSIETFADAPENSFWDIVFRVPKHIYSKGFDIKITGRNEDKVQKENDGQNSNQPTEVIAVYSDSSGNLTDQNVIEDLSSSGFNLTEKCENAGGTAILNLATNDKSLAAILEEIEIDGFREIGHNHGANKPQEHQDAKERDDSIRIYNSILNQFNDIKQTFKKPEIAGEKEIRSNEASTEPQWGVPSHDVFVTNIHKKFEEIDKKQNEIEKDLSLKIAKLDKIEEKIKDDHLKKFDKRLDNVPAVSDLKKVVERKVATESMTKNIKEMVKVIADFRKIKD